MVTGVSSWLVSSWFTMWDLFDCRSY